MKAGSAPKEVGEMGSNLESGEDFFACPPPLKRPAVLKVTPKAVSVVTPKAVSVVTPKASPSGQSSGRVTSKGVYKPPNINWTDLVDSGDGTSKPFSLQQMNKIYIDVHRAGALMGAYPIYSSVSQQGTFSVLTSAAKPFQHVVSQLSHAQEPESEKNQIISETNENISEKNENISEKNDEKSEKSGKKSERSGKKSVKGEGKSEKNEEKSEQNEEKSDKNEERSEKNDSENNVQSQNDDPKESAVNSQENAKIDICENGEHGSFSMTQSWNEADKILMKTVMDKHCSSSLNMKGHIIVGSAEEDPLVDVLYQNPFVSRRHVALQLFPRVQCGGKLCEKEGEKREKKMGEKMDEHIRTANNTQNYCSESYKKELATFQKNMEHALEWKLDVYIYDLGSSHGTYLNYSTTPLKPFEYTLLADGDVIHVGPAERVRRLLILSNPHSRHRPHHTVEKFTHSDTPTESEPNYIVKTDGPISISLYSNKNNTAKNNDAKNNDTKNNDAKNNDTKNKDARNDTKNKDAKTNDAKNIDARKNDKITGQNEASNVLSQIEHQTVPQVDFHTETNILFGIQHILQAQKGGTEGSDGKNSGKFEKHIKNMKQKTVKNMKNMEKNAEKNMKNMEENTEKNMTNMEKNADNNMEKNTENNMEDMVKNTAKNMKNMETNTEKNIKNIDKNFTNPKGTRVAAKERNSTEPNWFEKLRSSNFGVEKSDSLCCDEEDTVGSSDEEGGEERNSFQLMDPSYYDTSLVDDDDEMFDRTLVEERGRNGEQINGEKSLKNGETNVKNGETNVKNAEKNLKNWEKTEVLNLASVKKTLQELNEKKTSLFERIKNVQKEEEEDDTIDPLEIFMRQNNNSLIQEEKKNLNHKIELLDAEIKQQQNFLNILNR